MTQSTATLAFDRRTLLAQLEAAWRRSDQIFDLLAPAALHERPIALRQPFIFYLGHLPAFGWNQVMGGVLGRNGPHPELDTLFARGIDPVDVDAYQGKEHWPTVTETLAYRDRVRAALRDSFRDVEELVGRDPLADHGRVYQLVIEHELMHHETLLYMMQQLDRRLLRRPADLPAYRIAGAAAPGRVTIPAGRVRLGTAFDAVPFGWANEFPGVEQDVAAFAIDATAVRNGEWLAFVEAGGYEQPDLWAPEAWLWRGRAEHRHPVFWKQRDHRWRYVTLFDELPLEDVRDWPVYVSWAEADAYARWQGATLPTEAQFHRAAEGVHWGDAATGNYHFQQWAPEPAGRNAAGASRHGVRDLVGNGWEWTGTVFAPFPGFTAWARTYPGYSADFFDGKHYVMLGASWATDRALVRRTFRNWFQPHYPYVFAKFRCVRPAAV
jgi:ergothioneine biosynthesis protein EgtB